MATEAVHASPVAPSSLQNTHLHHTSCVFLLCVCHLCCTVSQLRWKSSSRLQDSGISPNRPPERVGAVWCRWPLRADTLVLQQQRWLVGSKQLIGIEPCLLPAAAAATAAVVLPDSHNISTQRKVRMVDRVPGGEQAPHLWLGLVVRPALRQAAVRTQG